MRKLLLLGPTYSTDVMEERLMWLSQTGSCKSIVAGKGWSNSSAVVVVWPWLFTGPRPRVPRKQAAILNGSHTE